MKYLVISFIVAILAVIFAVQNTTVVAVSFLSWSFEMSLAVIILCAAAFGVIVALPPMLYMQLRLKWQLRKSQQAQRDLGDENKSLKEKVEKLEKPEKPEALAAAPQTPSEQKPAEG